MDNGWIGVDLDGTLAHYERWVDGHVIGEPIHPMVDRVKNWLAEGRKVRIFTARIWPILIADPRVPDNVWPILMSEQASESRHATARFVAHAVQSWVQEHIGQSLVLTCVKDLAMIELWDDRAVQVAKNLGEPIGFSSL